MPFEFKEQIAKGTTGELKFAKGYHMHLTKIEKHWGDFRRADGRILELKTDYYDHSKTENFFIEQYSDFHSRKLGGPWQAYEKGASVFCYYFPSVNLYYEFQEVPLLLERLGRLTEGKPYVAVPNKGWITTGFKVSRNALNDLFFTYQIP